MENNDLLIKLRFNVQRNYPFFSALSRACDVRIDEKLKHEAGTTGKTILFNKDFINKNFNYQIMVFMHEIMHNALKHPLRIRNVKLNHDRQLFNIIADLKVNTILEKLKFIIPNDAVNSGTIENFLKMGGYNYVYDDIYYICDTNISMEEAYERIRSKQKYTKKFIYINNCMGNDLMEDESISDSEKREIEKEINNAIIEGLVIEKMRGNKSGFLVKIFEKILPKNEIDWKNILKNYIRTMLRGSRTWNKLHKKTFYTHQIFPGYKYKEKYNVVIGIDVSGSISDKMYKKFIGEIINLLLKHKCKILLVTFDVDIKSEVIIKSHKQFMNSSHTRKGYGGTSYKKFLEKYKNSKMKIIFTDGYGDQEELINKYKNVVWLITHSIDNFKFGKIIKIKEE